MTPSNSESLIRPQGADGLLFQGRDHRYEYLLPLVEHQDYNPLVLARRTPLRGGGPSTTVLLRRVVLPPRRERRQRALEDVAQPTEESPEVTRYNARVRTECPTWTSAGELADRIQRFGPEDVERVARRVPGQLKRILHKALRGNPEDRYQTGAELREDLRAYLRLGRPFGAAEAAAELAPLLFQKKSPQETLAFPTEKGVLPTPEEAE